MADIETEITYTYRVRVPVGLTRAELAAWLDAHRPTEAPEGWAAPDYSYPHPPPESAWVTVDGHRWAVSGACAIRHDCAIPGEAPVKGDGWVTAGGRERAGIAKMLGTVDAVPATKNARPYHPRFAAVLAAGSVREPSSSANVGPGFVLRDGACIAIVMPLNPHNLGGLAAIRADGSAWDARPVSG